MVQKLKTVPFRHRLFHNREKKVSVHLLYFIAPCLPPLALNLRLQITNFHRQLGIGVYSPKLDAQGNSVRGILVCKELASHLGLHTFEFSNVGSSFMQWLL